MIKNLIILVLVGVITLQSSYAELGYYKEMTQKLLHKIESIEILMVRIVNKLDKIK